MEHFMVKRRKCEGDEGPYDDEGACDSTYQLDDDERLPPEVKVKIEIPDDSAGTFSRTPQLIGSTPTDLPEVPYQPSDVPPYRDRRRPHLFQKKWYKEYPWLHYDIPSQSMFCFQCLSAVIKKVAECPPQNIFARGGFKNWKKGTERFRVHENSQLHRETSAFSVKRLFGLKEKCTGVESILSSINYLLSVGYDIRQRNLLQLLMLRKPDLPLLNEHLTKTTFSPSDERELLSIMTSSTMKSVSIQIKEAGSYGLILEKVEIHGKTMFAVTARISRFTKTEELYLGLYTEQNILHELVNYLDADELCTYSCDMAESRTIAEALEKIQPNALTAHCPNHNIFQDLQDVLKAAPGVGRCLRIIEELRKVIKKKNYFFDEYPVNQTPVSPNRTFTAYKTISTILTNYSDVIGEVESALNEDPSSFLAPYLLGDLKKCETFFSLLLCKVLFYPVENLNGILNKSESVKGSKEAVDSVLHILESFKAEKEYESFWRKYVQDCKMFEGLWSDAPGTISSQKALYFNTIDMMIEYLRSKFCNAGYENLLRLESALLKDDDKFLKEAESILKANDINADSLAMEKRMLTKIWELQGPFTLSQVVAKFRDLKTGTLGLLPEITKVIDLLLLAQVARCGDGRSHRLKNLRKFLEINRCLDLINELSILYVYKDEPYMNSRDVAQEYILESDSQRLEALFS